MSTNLLHPPTTLIGMCCIGIVIWAVLKLRKQFPLVALGLAWVLITFSINLAPRVNVIFEHKLYLMSFGFILAAATALSIIVRDQRRVILVLVGVLIILATMSFYRNGVWRNELILWEDIVTKAPAKSRVHANLGRMYGQTGQNEKAVAHLTKAIELDPTDDISFQNRAIMYYEAGFRDKALADFNKAIELNPLYFVTYIKRGWFYKKERQYDAAFADFAKAIEVEPNAADSYTERGIMLMELGRNAQALIDFNKALIADPYAYQALICRGVVYFLNKQYLLALKDFTLAQKINSSNVLGFKNAAYCLLEMNNIKEARYNFETALRLTPADTRMRTHYEALLGQK